MKIGQFNSILACTIMLSILPGCAKKTDAPAAKNLSTDSLYNTAIRDDDFGLIRFVNGAAEVSDSIDHERVEIQLSDHFDYGDVNGDGVSDAVGSYGVNAGGTGTFMSLAVFINRRGSPEFAGSYLLGDRVRPDSVTIRDQIITVYFMERTPDQPMSEPGSQVTRKQLSLINGKLIEQ